MVYIYISREDVIEYLDSKIQLNLDLLNDPNLSEKQLKTLLLDFGFSNAAASAISESFFHILKDHQPLWYWIDHWIDTNK